LQLPWQIFASVLRVDQYYGNINLMPTKPQRLQAQSVFRVSKMRKKKDGFIA